MIRKGTLEDIEILMEITSSCAKYMTARGIFQWNEHYPNAEAFKKDVQREELFVLQEPYTIIGCVVISTYMNEEYKSVEWLTKDHKNLYIHRLAVLPEKQGNGYAQKLMDFAEQFGRENGFKSIRLDTFSQNFRNQKFYELRGYQKLGHIYFPKQSEHPFHCYELTL